jgi:type IV pilus assembly protein PilY1
MSTDNPLLSLKIGLLATALMASSAIAVDIDDQPITTASTIKPNLMFILDDSGSMSWKFMPDAAYTTNNCSKNSWFNFVYYNPNIKYDLPKDYLGASFPAQVFTSAERNGFNTADSNDNLSTSFDTRDHVPWFGYDLDAGAAQPAYYYMYNNATGTPPDPTNTCKDNGSYVKVVVSATSCDSSYGRTCPSGADERVNFANWYSYYSTRMLMMKSGIATAFSAIDDKYRVGFSSLQGSLNFVPVSDFDGTQKNAWYNKLYGVFPNGGTPLHIALDRAGQYFSGATPYGASPDPMQYSCQKNFSILSTDGYWNAQTFPGNWDRTVPAAMPIRQGDTEYYPANTGLVQGANFPRPYYEGPTVNSSLLADVAMKYWVTDLRTVGAKAPNNVQTSSSDPAYWQHMNTITVGLGVNGALVFPDALAQITAGTANWPNTTPGNLTTIDDLWHTAVNGRGNYYKATDPTSLRNGLSGALRAITDSLNFAVGPTVSTNDLGASSINDFTQYLTSYKGLNWSGNVEKYNTDRNTGLRTGAALWSASKQIDLQYPNGGAQWINRKIVTKIANGTTVRFEYGNLDAAQQTALCFKATAAGACVGGDTKVVDFLRGDSTYEGDYGVAGKYFRNRKDIAEVLYYKRNLIGDIVDSSPVYIAAEDKSYSDTNDHDFAAYKNSTLSRAKTVYVGANDGMLHAINASTGDELWAYVPSFLIRNELDTSLPTPRENGLRALSYQDNGDPSFAHHFYVNGSMDTGAVNFNHVGSDVQGVAGDWHTILAGGLGKGGKGYFAIDVTAQTTDPIGKILWEFPRATDAVSISRMGYSFGKPLIVKTKAYGWVVILPSGYNNTDGQGYLFVLNAMTGALLQTLSTGAAAPGMAHINGLITANNAYVEQVYAGDLNGNIWRFDLEVPALPVRKIFTSSAITPITSEVEIAVDGNTGHRWIFASTGQYLNTNDRANTNSQYLVAVRDGTGEDPGGAVTSSTMADLTVVGSTLTGVAEPAVGWKFKLEGACTGSAAGGSERGQGRPFADLRTVAFVTQIPGDDPCAPGGCGNAYGLEYSTGKSTLQSASGGLLANVHSSSGFSGGHLIHTDKSATSAGDTRFVFTTKTGENISFDVKSPTNTSSTRHVGWREVLE